LRSLEFAIKSAIWLLKNRTKYDIFHVHGYCLGGLTSLVVAKLIGKKTIYKITLPGEDDPEALYRSRLGNTKLFLLKYFDAFVSISNRVQQRVENFGFGNTKTYTIPNGVEKRFCLDEAANREARRKLLTEFQLDTDARIVSFVGSIEYRKGVDILVAAWPRIISQVPKCRLFMIGPFFEQTNFHREFVSLIGEHLGRTVFLLGNVSDPECYYRASDVFVFPSRNESFGNVLVEAMACGRACVATLIDGVTESILLNGNNGIIVNKDDPEALAEAIVNVLTFSHLKCQLEENAAETVKDKFKIDTIADRYQKLYQSLLSGNCA